MNTILFVLCGLLVGFIFGFLLQKGRVGDFNTIVGQFLFKDFTVLKIMLTAVIVGGLLLYKFIYLGLLPNWMPKASSIIGSAVGGGIFGVGMATLGYCPGTALVALGSGARDAIFGLLGMVFGVAIFEMSYSFLKNNLLVDQPSSLTLPELIGISPFIIFAILIIFAIVLFRFLKRYNL